MTTDDGALDCAIERYADLRRHGIGGGELGQVLETIRFYAPANVTVTDEWIMAQAAARGTVVTQSLDAATLASMPQIGPNLWYGYTDLGQSPLDPGSTDALGGALDRLTAAGLIEPTSDSTSPDYVATAAGRLQRLWPYDDSDQEHHPRTAHPVTGVERTLYGPELVQWCPECRGAGEVDVEEDGCGYSSQCDRCHGYRVVWG